MMRHSYDADTCAERLKARREQLLAEIREATERVEDHPYAELSGAAPDSGEAATADVMIDLEHAAVSRDLQEMRSIDAALARISAGTFGVCIDCHAEIAAERLNAYPSASRCIDCQTSYDNTHAHERWPIL
jgi:DnaK suppressor protein